MLQDLRFAFRALRHSPGFSAGVALTLALGVGTTTAMIAVIDAVLVRPLPYPASGAMVELVDLQTKSRPVTAFSYPEFVDIRDRAGDVLAEVGAFAGSGMVLSGSGDAEQLTGVRMSVGMPAMLGVTPLIGRTFRPGDDRPDAPPVVMLSDGLWRSHFAGDPAIVGRTITVTGTPSAVIGVFPSTSAAIMPSRYQLSRGHAADLWMPLQLDVQKAPRGLHQMEVVGRLRNGISRGQAASRLDVVMAGIQKDRGTTHGLRIEPLTGALLGDVTEPLLLLLGSVGLVLAIACGNVANLLLSRFAARQREFALRQALGAGRSRLVRLVLVESAVRALVGGMLGVGLAFGIVSVARASLAAVPRIVETAVDARVLAAALVISLGSGLLFGATPALRAVRRDVVASLGGRGGTTHAAGDRVRQALLIAEIALSFVLLATAGLVGESYVHLVAVPTGFDATNVASARVWLPPSRYPDGTADRAFFDRLVERVGAVVGADAVTLASDLPVAGGTSGTVTVEGRDSSPNAQPYAEKRIVAANYFGVMKARLARGRFFDPNDRPGSEPVLVINQAFANQWFDGQDPIGKHVGFSWGITGQQTVIGVVADIQEGRLDQAPSPAVYISSSQRPTSDMHVIVRSPQSMSNVVGTIRAAVRDLDPALPLIDIDTLSGMISSTIRAQRVTVIVMAAFAAGALLLAAVGLYGVIAYSVSQRTREIGVRAALGAQPTDIVRLVMRQTALLTGVGTVLGLGGAWGIGRLLASQLFGVAPVDLRIWAGVAALLVVVSFLAGAVPTTRAMRIDPMTALRSD